MTTEQKLREALQECADELEAEIEARYGESKTHPAMVRKYRLDMETVVKAREALSEPPTSDKG